MSAPPEKASRIQSSLKHSNNLAYFEGFDDHREGGTVQHDLSFLGEIGEQLLDNGCELGTEKLIGLVHDKGRAFAEISDALSCEIEDTSRSSDNDVNSFAETHDIVLECGASGCDHDLDAHVFTEGLADLSCLKSQLTSWYEKESLDSILFDVDLFERGDKEGGGLSCAVLGSGKDISACESNGYGLFLDRGWTFESSLKNAHQELALEKVVLELVALGGCDILQYWEHVYTRVSLHEELVYHQMHNILQQSHMVSVVTSVWGRVSFVGRFSCFFQLSLSCLITIIGIGCVCKE